MKNGTLRTWAIGFVVTLLTALITNGILFQRDTREQLATLQARIKFIEIRGRAALEREFAQRDEAIQRLEKQIEALGLKR
jgi:hypothetical protein